VGSFALLLVLSGSAWAQAPAGGGAAPPTVELLGITEQRVRKVSKDLFAGFESLTVRFAIRGAAVKEAFRVGNLKVTEAKDEAGSDLVLAETAQAFQRTNRPDFADVGRFDRREDRLEREVVLKPAARSAKWITLKGSLELVVGGTDVHADIDAVKLKEERALEHADLAGAGLKIRLVKQAFGGERQIHAVFEGDQRCFREFAVLDKAGKASRLEPRGWFQSGKGPKVHSFGAAGALPAEATLRVTVRKGAATVTVPFAFERTELP
jgi:hypothetical protein